MVVSGDVQEEAVRRVKALGALAFIKKPADPEVLRATLLELGLFDPKPTPGTMAQAALLDELKVNFRDALREVSNVAMRGVPGFYWRRYRRRGAAAVP